MRRTGFDTCCYKCKKYSDPFSNGKNPPCRLENSCFRDRRCKTLAESRTAACGGPCTVCRRFKARKERP